jgi:ABC-type sulfate/molybdate transport systems ATPase subunit
MYSVHLRETIPHERADSREPSAAAAAAWHRAVRAILERYRRRETPAVFPVTPDARQALHEFHNRTVDLRNGTMRDEESLLGRIRENALRLALGQSVLDVVTGVTTDEVVTVEQAQRGIALAEYGHFSVVAFRAPARHRKRQERLRTLVDILRDRGGEATLRVLRCHHGFSGDEVERLAHLFGQKLRLEKRTSSTTTGGRPSEVCVLIPPGANGASANPQK